MPDSKNPRVSNKSQRRDRVSPNLNNPLPGHSYKSLWTLIPGWFTQGGGKERKEKWYWTQFAKSLWDDDPLFNSQGGIGAFVTSIQSLLQCCDPPMNPPMRSNDFKCIRFQDFVDAPVGCNAAAGTANSVGDSGDLEKSLCFPLVEDFCSLRQSSIQQDELEGGVLRERKTAR